MKNFQKSRKISMGMKKKFCWLEKDTVNQRYSMNMRMQDVLNLMIPVDVIE